MYVRMYVCVYVCMYVCMYVCLGTGRTLFIMARRTIVTSQERVEAVDSLCIGRGRRELKFPPSSSPSQLMLSMYSVC